MSLTSQDILGIFARRIAPLVVVGLAFGVAGCGGGGGGDGDSQSAAVGGPQPPVTELVVGEGEARALLEWEAPTVNADGTAVTDLSGFFVHVSYELPVTPESEAVYSVGDTTYVTLHGLPATAVYFRVSAVDLNGNESELSEEQGTELLANEVGSAGDG